jgi:hypothetical protein
VENRKNGLLDPFILPLLEYPGGGLAPSEPTRLFFARIVTSPVATLQKLADKTAFRNMCLIPQSPRLQYEMRACFETDTNRGQMAHVPVDLLLAAPKAHSGDEST